MRRDSRFASRRSGRRFGRETCSQSSVIVSNGGTATARNVVVCVPAPGHATFVSAPGAVFRRGSACWSIGAPRRSCLAPLRRGHACRPHGEPRHDPRCRRRDPAGWEAAGEQPHRSHGAARAGAGSSRRRHRVTVRQPAALLLVAALASAGAAHAVGNDRPSRGTGAEVARVVALAVVRPLPGAGPIVRMLATRTSWSGARQQLLVLASRTGPDGRPWLLVRLPGRPNGSSGWIRRDRVVVRHVPWWIDVSLSRRLVQVFRNGTLVRRFHAVVGAPSTPSPVGLYAVYEADPQPSASAFVGSWVIQLTAFSRTCSTTTAAARAALRSTAAAARASPIRSAPPVRTDASAANLDVQWLARSAPAGKPVRIRR